MRFHLIVFLKGEKPKISHYNSPAAFNAARDKAKTDNDPLSGYVFAITEASDCEAMSITQLAETINALRPGQKPIKTLHDRKSGAARVWTLLDQPDAEDIAAESSANAEKNSQGSSENSVAPSEGSEYNAEQEGGSAPEADASNGKSEEEMKNPKTKKPAKKAAAKKPAAETIPLDKFGLREGTKNSQAAAMWASPKGATMAEVKEKVGDTKYNLMRALVEKGHLVEKDEEGRIYLKAKK